MNQFLSLLALFCPNDLKRIKTNRNLEIKGFFDQFRNFLWAFIGIVDPEVVGKSDLAFVADTSLIFIIIYQTPI